MATRLFVGNLPESTDESNLRTVFSNYGNVTQIDLKSKPGSENENKKFAFVSLSASISDIESCIKHFSSENYNGSRLYVTRARESFLERLQRERVQVQEKEAKKEVPIEVATKTPVIKLGEKLNPRKRKNNNITTCKHAESDNKTFNHKKYDTRNSNEPVNVPEIDKKKYNSEQKRMESMKMKRQQFKEKQMIIKTGLTAIDKVSNKKIKFSDNEDERSQEINGHQNNIQNTSKPDKSNILFDESEDSGEELNFNIKKQFEGKKGQQILDLQSRYKSDKRFVLDERFIDDSGAENDTQNGDEDEKVDLEQINEKDKQLDILQDVLGVTIKRKLPADQKVGKKPKLGMLRFDPTQPQHAKFFVPQETNQEPTKKSKKTKDKPLERQNPEQKTPDEPRPEVSKEQFYKVSNTLKEAIAQPATFSLRSLFNNNETKVEESTKEEASFIPLEAPKKSKTKHPLDLGEKNPFIYDSSESEDEETVNKEQKMEAVATVTESKAVWKECLFFGVSDQRLKDGLAFFNNTNKFEPQKERRELKSLMKKRIYNKERKNQMFQKKIGGRKKTIKKLYRKKS